MRADLLSEKVLPETILTLAYQKKATTVSQILVLVFQQYMPAESAVRLDGMSAMEQPLRPARAFEDAVNTLRSWQSKLRIVLHDLNANPEPLRLFSSVNPLLDSLTHSDADFSYSVSFLTRSTRVRTECTMDNLLAFIEGLESELALRATQEQERKRRQLTGSQPQGYGNAAEENNPSNRGGKGKTKGRGRNDRRGKEDRKDSSRRTPSRDRTPTPQGRRSGGRSRSNSPHTTRRSDSKAKREQSKNRGKSNSKKRQSTSPKNRAKNDKGKSKPRITCPDYLTDSGCPKGGQCPMYHPPVNGRCLRCGSKGHAVATCRRPRSEKRQSTPAQGSVAEEWPGESEEGVVDIQELGSGMSVSVIPSSPIFSYMPAESLLSFSDMSRTLATSEDSRVQTQIAHFKLIFAHINLLVFSTDQIYPHLGRFRLVMAGLWGAIL